MASSTTSATDVASDKNASVRKHYKIVVDCIRRLDLAAKEKQNIAAISQPETNLIRDRLRDSCERLLFLSPLEYGKKAEDQIWKKCFYEPVQILRANKERLNEKQSCWAVMFVQSAVGYYHGFLLRLQHEFGVDVNVDVSQCCVSSSDKQSFERRTWGLAAVRKTLIYLGDLMRYSLDLFGNEQDFYLAEHYYLEAHSIDPSQGMPMNQLGTLAEERNFGVDALFYYIRGLLSKESFEGTLGNISFVLKRTKKTSEQLKNNENDKLSSCDQFNLAYVPLMGIFFEDSEITPQEFADAVQSTLTKLRAALRSEDDIPQKITPMIIFRVLLIEMMIRMHLERKGSVKLRAITVFILDNMSILFDHIADLLKQKQASALAAASTRQVAPVESKNSRVHKNSEPKRGGMRAQRPIVRRRRRGSISDQDEEDDADSDEFGRHSASPISDVDSVASEHDDGADVVELSDSDDDEQSRAKNAVDRNSEGLVDSTNMTPVASTIAIDKSAALLDCDWLKVVKLAVDWLRFSVDLLTSTADERHPVWKALANLSNEFPSELEMSNGVGNGAPTSDVRSSLSWQQKDVLPEDVWVRGVPVFDKAHAGFNWDERCRLSPAAQVATRLLTVRSFCHYLAEMKLAGFVIDRDTAHFSVLMLEKKSPFSPQYNETIPSNRPPDMEQRNNVMKNMGKLRMQEEMRQMQKDAWVPVYLVPDLGVLTDQLHILKQLTGAHKFVVVVQQTIIRTLDKMKKESAAVRESIRWLEMCLQQGNKYVRAQKETEHLTLDDVSDLSRETNEALSCCASLSSNVSSGGATIATLLTSHSVGSPPFRTFQEAIRKRAIHGVDIANVLQFNRRWLAHSKQHG